MAEKIPLKDRRDAGKRANNHMLNFWKGEMIMARFALVTMLLFMWTFTTSKSPAQTTSSPAASSSSEQTDWHKADPKRVCMVTNMEFPRDQIPVKVKSTTYYGCCENCKDRLANDEDIRMGTDPISGKKIDKAKASIAAGPDGSVEYFENDVNMNKFIASKKK